MIDEWHSPLYFFPRDCPRIALWPVETTSPPDRAHFKQLTKGRMKLFIERPYEREWREGRLWVYEFGDLQRFEDTGDIGVWVSRESQVPDRVRLLADMPGAAEAAGIEVAVVDSLVETASQIFDFERREFTTSLHVSFIRMSAYPAWPIPLG